MKPLASRRWCARAEGGAGKRSRARGVCTDAAKKRGKARGWDSEATCSGMAGGRGGAGMGRDGGRWARGSWTRERTLARSGRALTRDQEGEPRPRKGGPSLRGRRLGQAQGFGRFLGFENF